MFDLNSLDPFIGYWSGESEIAPNPWSTGGTKRGRWGVRFDTARKNVIFNYEQSGADGAGFDGHGVFCADPDSENLYGFWFDDRGFPPFNPLRGQWQDNRLVLLNETPRGHGRWTLYVEQTVLHYEIEGHMPEQEAYSDILRGQYHRT
ncbi:hypothetical protein [Asticcacaulis sp.]|uniref:hypothetical protein n=1 Tax=Asticcacaulis sp. TaxID=1872648 RepID=UPI002CD88094|nr:hypothetical protein [Asticcacaulis sp.]HTM81821.1 hypothetical protein [Asticcacaulis sp.]